MSHFSVLVFGPDVEKQLQPYHEFESTGEDDEHVQTIDVTEDLRKQYDEFDGEEYISFAEYAADECGVEIVDDESKINLVGDHKYGYALVTGDVVRVIDRTNPQAQWDWWMVGGRWNGFFKLKPGASGENGEGGILTRAVEPGWACVAKKGDIDFEGMRDQAEVEKMKIFDVFADIMDGKEIPDWEAVLAENGDDVEAAHKDYQSRPVIMALQERAHTQRLWIDDFRDYFCNGDRAAVAARARKKAFTTFAVIHDGKWYERGSMGWFGAVANEKQADDWESEFNKILDSVDDDTLLTVVDCHI